MTERKQARVLMLGWEYPPRFAGGLGKVCRGLSQAMARQGTEVLFVLPSFPEPVAGPSLNVVGAREALLFCGWNEEQIIQAQSRWGSERDPGGKLLTMGVGARLYPYGAHPPGPTPKRIQEFMTGKSEVFRAEGPGIREWRASGGWSVGKGYSSPEIYGRNLWSEIERYSFAIRHIAENAEIDVVHAHDWMTFPAAFETQQVRNVPVFLHVHATEYDRSGDKMNSEIFAIEREGFLRAQHIFAVSQYTADVIERLYGVMKRKISVIYNAPDDGLKESPSDTGPVRESNVVFLGRLTFQKGPDHFLKAASLVSQANSHARFVICGTGDMFDSLRRLAHELEIEDRTCFTGFVEPSGVEELLRRSKVLVMPSVSEPFGLVALEAIHCGMPVIMSKQSGVSEVLRRALHVDFWDHHKLADQILAALRLNELSGQLVREGMEQVQGLSWDKSAQKVIHVYRRFVQKEIHGH